MFNQHNDPIQHKMNLHQLQQWMQTVITHPLGVAAGVNSDSAKRQIDVDADNLQRVICRSSRRTSLQRLEVYSNAYLSRLLECLREMFPALAIALGVELFDEFAFDYLQQHPSQSYTLGDLANHFVEHLEKTRPSRPQATSPTGQAVSAASDQGGPATFSGGDWADFIIDLARLEWTIDDVFDGPGVENESPISPHDLQQLTPNQWLRRRLVGAPCLRLLSFKFPVNDYYSEFRTSRQEPPFPSPQETYLALTRRDYVIRRIPLSRPQYDLLSSLIAGDTLENALSKTDSTLDPFQLRNWFEDWTAAGFFIGLM